MIHALIHQFKKQWMQSDECRVQEFIRYIKERGQLRDAQIEAIETYLFLKIKGQNKSLAQLFCEGFFNSPLNLDKLNINQNARDFLNQNPQALALYQFAGQATANNKALLPELQKHIIDAPESLNYPKIIEQLFYNVNYADYLMSLPMGAGKTYLMAAFIYIDLYFAQIEPENPAFAHNFLVLIPNGLKNSIVPSLKTIAHFDPTWVIPEPAASQIKSLLKFDVLDVAKSAKKSNQTRNPNAQKVNACLPNPFGQIFVVNAEKVILENFDAQDQLDGIDTPSTRNELKSLFGKIPHLSLLIDEVHHAATDDIKLRQAVNYWHEQGNITTVLGFSGTPYLQKPESISLGEYTAKLTQITNTVYYYPLKTAIERFLKKPTVKVAHQLDRLQIIKQGIDDFKHVYSNFTYPNGCIPKIAIYCSNIATLEEQVYPYLVGELGISADEILKFHGGNSEYSLPKENELEFRNLDLPQSKKRYILLVQVGKEGWDCRSLTGVILSQKGDSPTNMVLQTACRCLREMNKNQLETALIWLNSDNAQTLNKQLKQEQNTSIDEINAIDKNQADQLIARTPRITALNLPSIPFKQLRVNYQHIQTEDTANTAEKLQQLYQNLPTYQHIATVGSSQMDNIEQGQINLVQAYGHEWTNYTTWLLQISKDSLGRISLDQLREHDTMLKPIYEAITYSKDTTDYLNEQYHHNAINNAIRLAFSIKRSLETTTETVPQDAQLLLVDKLSAVMPHANLYPNQTDTAKILEFDQTGANTQVDIETEKTKYNTALELLTAQGMAHMMQPFETFVTNQTHSAAVIQKNRSFHYLPYDFRQSGFELKMLDAILREPTLEALNLEIYYNGERGLTEFVIDCYKQRGQRGNQNAPHWQKIGRYTPDFLVIRRTPDNTISQAMIIETKGDGFAANFNETRAFMQGEFLKVNPQFDFLYLEDRVDLMVNLNTFKNRIQQFFSLH